MDIEKIINKKIGILFNELIMTSDKIASKKINKADYDQTLVGFVLKKIIPENSKDGSEGKIKEDEFKTYNCGTLEYEDAISNYIQSIGEIEDIDKNTISFVNKFGDKKYQWKVVENDNGYVILSRGEMKEDDVENG